MDILTFRPGQLHLLITKVDGAFFHVHKTIGLLCLIHYTYRIWEWLHYGNMLFDGGWFTLASILMHAALSGSSMIFHLPAIRNPSAPMIWPEFRLHSILFAMRSICVMLYHWVCIRWHFAPYIEVRIFAALMTMKLVDEVTLRLPPQGSTMRGMPFPSYASYSFKYGLNLMYSVFQVYATLEVIVRSDISNAFMVMFPIQLAAFLMTCVRKNIITTAGWHFWYTLALYTTLAHSITNTSSKFSDHERFWYHSCAKMFIIGRFILGLDKYLVWAYVNAILCLIAFPPHKQNTSVIYPKRV